MKNTQFFISRDSLSVSALLKTLLFSLPCAFFLSSCGNSDPGRQVDEGDVSDGIYRSEEIGWTIQIPAGVEVSSISETERLRELGAGAMEDTLDEGIDTKGVKTLIGFQFDRFNRLQSTTEPFKDIEGSSWEENNDALKDLIRNTYKDQGVAAKFSETRTEKIDGLDFRVYDIAILAPDQSVILNQILYSRLINGFDFSVNINYQREENKEVMMTAWKSSRCS